MTDSEVIEVLEKEESYMLSHGGDRQAKALRIAIDKIKQEPFINKPCVSSEVCKHDKQKVLDKIRAEITELDNEVCQRFLIEDIDKEVHHTYQECLDIINKYKSESEG